MLAALALNLDGVSCGRLGLPLFPSESPKVVYFSLFCKELLLDFDNELLFYLSRRKERSLGMLALPNLVDSGAGDRADSSAFVSFIFKYAFLNVDSLRVFRIFFCSLSFAFYSSLSILI